MSLEKETSLNLLPDLVVLFFHIHHRKFSIIVKMLINDDVIRWPEKLSKYFFLMVKFNQKIRLNLYKPEINFLFVCFMGMCYSVVL